MFNFEEKHLIKRTQHGDTEAFTPLVRKYHSKIYKHILGRVKDTETAKDLTQETWLKAFRAIKAFRGTASFYSWIYRIAENVYIDFFRKQRGTLNVDSLQTVEEHCITATHPCPSEAIEHQELRKIIRFAIRHLPPTRKRVFLLRYAEELPIKDIASRIKRSEGTVKTHLHKAHHQLRELLTPYLQNCDIPWL